MDWLIFLYNYIVKVLNGLGTDNVLITLVWVAQPLEGIFNFFITFLFWWLELRRVKGLGVLYRTGEVEILLLCGFDLAVGPADEVVLLLWFFIC